MQDVNFTAPDFGSSPRQYFKEAKAELKKVIWPSKQQTINYTIMVFTVSFIVGALLGGFDFLFTKIISYLY